MPGPGQGFRNGKIQNSTNGNNLGEFVGFGGCTTWILHEPEAFIGKAFKGEAIVFYANPLIIKAL